MSTFLIFLLFSFLQSINSYRILVFSPGCSKSHLISNGRLADELAQAGHHVTLLEIDMLNNTRNTKTSKFATRRIVEGLESAPKFQKLLSDLSENVMHEPSVLDIARGFWSYQKSFNEICEEFLKNHKIFDEMKAAKFDAFFGEQINMCGFGYAHALQIPRRFLIVSCPFHGPAYDQIGLPMAIADIPMTSDLSPNPTIGERAINIAKTMTQLWEFRILNMYLTDIFRAEYGQEFPQILDILREIDFSFVTTDEIVDHSSVTLQNVLHVGGLGIPEDHSELKEPFLSEMKKGKNGVVLFSLGTIANTTRLPKTVMQSFLKIVQQFPDYHFLVRADKYDVDTFEASKTINNVIISDWLPQPQILNHPRLKLFITHAGYNSIMESARAGVPLITIPFMFDQNQNSRAVEMKKWGIRRTKDLLISNPESIREAIYKILNEPEYTQNAHRIRDLIASKPMSSKEKFIKTTEWVIENKGVPELLFQGRNTNTIIYYNLDIILPIFLFFGFILIPSIIKMYVWSCFGHLSDKKSKVE
ncbi:unnamed protein product [Caenorhabditis angaria]|uniref:UDP-glucuronosyltransferase n=1 Tax=Caenorhabditis angaria TaxID=860376 RepID=A0A9P1N4V6_9PELO|nr:unnamed protein product [Caenorhabditis angaria]